MRRLRETLARESMTVLALIFALAFAGFYVVAAISQIVISSVQQQFDNRENLSIETTVFGTEIYLDPLVQGTVAVLLLLLALFGAWRLPRRFMRSCPDCLSEIPREASTCRYCMAELRESDT